jgi:hypothetical protein
MVAARRSNTVFCSHTKAAGNGDLLTKELVAVAVSLLCGVLLFTACGVFIPRRAELRVKVIAGDGRADASCTGTALLFGHEEASMPVALGGSAALTVTMLSPLRTPVKVVGRVAVQAECPGYERVTTASREVEMEWRHPPIVDFGDVTMMASGKSK